MIIHNAAITGSLTLNGIDISDITGSEAGVGALNSFSSSILSYTASNDARLTALNAQTASLLAYTSSNDARVAALNTFSSSILSYTSSNDANILSAFANISSLSAGSASSAVKINALNTFSASILSYTASNTTTIFSLNAAVAELNSYTSSLNAKTASFATTGSNTFTGQQYISNTANANGFANSTSSFYTDGGMRVTKDMYVSGTAYFNNITVFGTQSVAYISSSQLNIGTNIITVNTDTPSVRFGGLAVYDSGSTGLTGSILWDSQNNHWVYSNPSGSSYSGGMFISGPRSAALGSEQGTTNNALMKGQGGDHITSSAVFDVSGSVGIGTSSPTATLDVVGAGKFSSNITAKGTLTIGDAGVTNAIINSADGMYFNIDSDASGGNPEFMFGKGRSGAGGGGTTFMTVNASGNVGIGTTSPGDKLDVIGRVSAYRYIAVSSNASLPAYATDTSTGLFNAATNQIGVSINGTEKVRIDTNGNVGIGTTSPGYALDVQSSGSYAANFQQTTNNTYGAVRITGNNRGGELDFYSGSTAIGSIWVDSSIGGNMHFALGSGFSEKMFISGSGNVGIGTTAPNYRLHVYNPSSASYFDGGTTDTSFYISHGGHNPGSQTIAGIRTNTGSPVFNAKNGGTVFFNRDINAANVEFQYSTGSNTALFISGSGNVYVNSTSGAYPTSGYNLGIKGISSQAFISIARSSQTLDSQGLVLGIDTTEGALYVRDNLPFSIYTNNAFAVRVAANGNVGIGTTSPGYKLDVSADINDGNIIRAINLNSGAAATARIYVENNVSSLGQLTTYSSGFGFNVFGSAAGNFTALLSSGASSAGLLIGSLTSDPMIFGTDNTERMRITSTGAVGIGTTSPFGTATDRTVLSVNGTTDVSLNVGTGGTQRAYLYAASSYADLGTIGSLPLTFSPNNGEKMRITSGGNVGIGTSSPTAKFHISGDGSAFNQLRINHNGTGTNGYLDINVTDTRAIIATNYSSTNIPLEIKSYGNTNQLFLATGGNIGIGTSNPSLATLQIGNTGANYNAAIIGNATAGIEIRTNSAGGRIAALEQYFGNEGSLWLYLSNSTKVLLRADGASYLNGGNVGIGTTSPTTKLEVIGGTSNINGYADGSIQVTGLSPIAFVASSNLNPSLNRWGFKLREVNDGDFSIYDYRNSVNRVLINSSGNVGIGTTSPGTTLQVDASKSNTTVSAPFNSDILRLNNTNATTNALHGILLTRTNGASLTSVGAIMSQVTTQTVGNAAADLIFYTATSDVISERMRIFSGGEVYINATTNPLPDNAAPQLGITAKASTDAINLKHLQNANNTLNIWQTGTTQHNAIAFYKGDTQTNRGNIVVTTSGTTYTSVSDYRLKENITPLENGLDRLMQLKPSKFNWIENGIESEGFIAHELQEYFPDAVSGEKDAVYSSTGNIKAQSVDYGRITPLLVKALQELKAEFDEYKSTHP